MVFVWYVLNFLLFIREWKHFLINVLCHIKIKGELNEFDLFILHFFHTCLYGEAA